METPITGTGGNAPCQKQAQMHLTGPSITVFKVRPFGRSGSAGSQTGSEGQRGSEAVGTAQQAGKKVGELRSRRLVSHSTHGSRTGISGQCVFSQGPRDVLSDFILVDMFNTQFSTNNITQTWYHFILAYSRELSYFAVTLHLTLLSGQYIE